MYICLLKEEYTFSSSNAASIHSHSTSIFLNPYQVEFGSREEAIAFCEKNGWEWVAEDPPVKPPRAKSYAANFSWNKRTRRSTK